MLSVTLLAEIEPAYCQTLKGRGAPLDHLLCGPAQQPDKQSGNRPPRDGPHEPVRPGRRRRGCGTPRIIDRPAHRRGGSPCRLGTGRSCSPCCIVNRVEEARAAEQLAKPRGNRRSDVVFLTCEKACDAAAVETAGTLLLGNRAHDKRPQAGEQRRCPRPFQRRNICRPHLRAQPGLAVAKKRAEHSRSAINQEF